MTRFIKKRNEIKPPKKRQQKEKNAVNLKENSSEIKDKYRTSGSDITMCKGGKCPFKDICRRYTAQPDELWQSYFIEPPFKIIKGKPSCEMFWGEAADSLFLMLKEIMEGKHNADRKKNTKGTSKKGKRNNKKQ